MYTHQNGEKQAKQANIAGATAILSSTILLRLQIEINLNRPFFFRGGGDEVI